VKIEIEQIRVISEAAQRKSCDKCKTGKWINATLTISGIGDGNKIPEPYEACADCVVRRVRELL